MSRTSYPALVRRWAIGAGLLVASFVVGFWAGAWSISEDIRGRARRDVEVALALSASDAQLEQLRQRFAIPAALQKTDEATRYYLLSARDVDEGSETGANYFLALHFMTRDCVVTRYYLREQLRVNGQDPRVSALLRSIDEKGCAAAMETMPQRRRHE